MSAKVPDFIRGPSVMPASMASTQRGSDVEESVDVEKARHARAEDLSSVVRREQCSRDWFTPVEQLVVARRFAESHVHVGIDESRHDGEVGCIDDLHVRRALGGA